MLYWPHNANPQQQFVEALIQKKVSLLSVHFSPFISLPKIGRQKRQLEQMYLGDLKNRDYVLRIRLM
jgi:hypothetical protein